MTEYATVSPIQFHDTAIAERNYEITTPTIFAAPNVSQFLIKLSIANRDYELTMPTEFLTPNVPQFKLQISSTILGVVCISPILFNTLSIAERDYEITTPTEFFASDLNIYSYGSTINILDRTGILIPPNILI